MSPISRKHFLEDLEIYRREAAQCAQFVYTYLAIHALAADEDIRRGINEEALFWNTMLGSLQTSMFIALGRVFDSANQHGPTALVGKVRAAQRLFSRRALAARKKAIFGKDRTGLKEYLKDTRVPGEREFARLERLAKGYTDEFNGAVYRELRNRVFGHLVYTKADKVTSLFSQTNIDDLQRMVSFLYRLHGAIREAYDNGTPLRLRRARRSVLEMLEKPKGRRLIKPVAEEITAETKRVMQRMALANPPGRRNAPS